VADVAPDTFVQVLPDVSVCHWYVIVPEHPTTAELSNHGDDPVGVLILTDNVGEHGTV
jgi:2,3-bisphosphoglycerate-independent phosphoglycerate mutase